MADRDAPTNRSETIQRLKERVDVLIRSMQGSLERHRQGSRKDQGLEKALLLDGWDERTQRHQEPVMSKEHMLENFQEVVSKLDEVGSLSSGLMREIKAMGDHVVVPRGPGMSLSFNFADIPICTNSILPPDVHASRDALLTSARERIKGPLPSTQHSGALQVETEKMLEEVIQAPLKRVRDELRSVRQGSGVRKQARLSYEPGLWSKEAEDLLIGAVCAENALRIINQAQAAGLQAKGEFIAIGCRCTR